MRATHGMEEHNSRLEASLKASKQEISQLQTNLEAVRNESLTDPLTSLANRKYFDTALESSLRIALQRASRWRSCSPTSITSRRSTTPTAI